MKKHSILRKILVSALVFVSALAGTQALEVSRGELQSVNADTIRFNNYNGPHTVIDSLAAIRNIGTGLGRTVAGNLENESTAGSADRYYVIHAVDSTTGKLDADIFVLGKNVGVDHVRNLRHIVAAYLVEAYKYSNDDAFTLATFITVYNAVYRGNLDVFNAKYKDVVTKHLHKERVGLSVNWQEWAGATEMVIPLADIAGGLSTIDTSVISDRNVIDSMRESDDRGIEQRKGMVGIMDREADTAESRAEEAAKQAVQETRRLNEEQKKLAEEQKRTGEAEKSAADAQKSADAAQAAADKAAEEARKAAEAADKASQSADEARKSADEAQKAAGDAQKAAEDAQKAADEARAEAERKQKEADEAWAKADELQKKADELAEYARQHPEDAEAQKAASDAQKAADEAKAEAEKKSGDAEKAQSNAEQKQSVADEKAGSAEEQQKQADAKANESEQKQSDAEKKQSDAEQKQSVAEKKQSDAEQKQSVADEKAEDAAKQKEVEQAQKEKTDEQAEKAKAASDEAAEQQEIADKKRAEAQNERNLIARDQQQLLNEGLLDEKDAAFGLQLTDSAKELSSVVKMNAKTGSIVKTSPVSVIRQRELIPVDGGLVAIAGEDGANHTIRLVLLDTADMEIQKESVDVVASQSVLVYNGGSFYIVVQDGGNYVVAKYSQSLELEIKSTEAVDPATPITVGANGVCVTAKDGTMLVLRLSDLSKVSGEISKGGKHR